MARTPFIHPGTDRADGLPEGVRLCRHQVHPDDRGTFSEIFREEWNVGVRPVQWNLVRSRPGVLRGAHVHLRHSDYLLLVQGRASVGLKDLRDGSPTWGLSAVVDLDAASPGAIVIPTGVAHAFFFHEPSVHVYSVSHYWDEEDELGCHWADPDLGIPWSVAPTLLSPRDAAAPPMKELVERIRSRRSGAGKAGERPPDAPDQAVRLGPLNLG